MSAPLLMRRSVAASVVSLSRAAASETFGTSAEDLCKRINALDPPPAIAVTPADVWLFRARVANDQVDAYSTRFTPNALAQVAAGIVGVPTLLNHDSYSAAGLPVGRWFSGDQEKDEAGVNWATAYTYLSADARDEQAATLAVRAGLGIIREVSLSWWQDAMKCSICGKDLWSSECPHILGEPYGDQTCEGIMESIREVAEASLVWKGGQFGTTLEPVGRSDDVDSLAKRIALKRSKVPGDPGGALGDYLRRLVGMSPGAGSRRQ